jgi:hypothetical protein
MAGGQALSFTWRPVQPMNEIRYAWADHGEWFLVADAGH